MRKSETGSYLPTIKSHRTSLSGRSKMKSFFLERVKKEVSVEKSYEEMESSLLGDEQKRLKQLLRQFNDQSQSILSDYIAIPVSKNDSSSPKQTYDDVRKILQREEQILNKMREQCFKELQLLENRCENLKYTTREEMQRQIRHTKQQIEQIKVSNKDLERDLKLNGLNICKGEPFDLVKELEVDKIKVDDRLVQCKKNEEEVKKEIQDLRAKAVSTQQDINKKEAQYRSALSQKEESEYIEKLKQSAKEKKKNIDHLIIKNEQVSGALKQRYLTKLRQLDDRKTESKKLNDQIMKKQQDSGKSRKDLIILEHQLSALKQKAHTVQLLTKK